jgi:hypothetical protein
MLTWQVMTVFFLQNKQKAQKTGSGSPHIFKLSPSFASNGQDTWQLLVCYRGAECAIPFQILNLDRQNLKILDEETIFLSYWSHSWLKTRNSYSPPRPSDEHIGTCQKTPILGWNPYAFSLSSVGTCSSWPSRSHWCFRMGLGRIWMTGQRFSSWERHNGCIHFPNCMLEPLGASLTVIFSLFEEFHWRTW